jgi:hypothetical protein
MTYWLNPTFYKFVIYGSILSLKCISQMIKQNSCHLIKSIGASGRETGATPKSALKVVDDFGVLV